MIEFHKSNSNRLYSFAKGELESLIVRESENLQLPGKLTPEMVREVRSVVPDYMPLRELQPGGNLRPEKLKKPPKMSEDYPKPPKLPRAPMQ